MNILFCGDRNIAHGVITATLSLMDHTAEPLSVYVLTASVKTSRREFTSLDRGFESFLTSVVKKTNPDSFVKIYDLTDAFAEKPPTANLETRFTPCCMLRLYADLVKDLPDRLLYLDNDIICRGDLSELYYSKLGQNEIAGVLDHYGSRLFRQKPFKRDYINSGVLLLDLSKIRKSRLFERCRCLCAEKEMFMPDQSALNKLCLRKKLLPRKFNEQRKLCDSTVIQHFTTHFRFFPFFKKISVKPWDIHRMHTVLKITEYDALLKRSFLLYQEYLQTEKETLTYERYN